METKTKLLADMTDAELSTERRKLLANQKKLFGRLRHLQSQRSWDSNNVKLDFVEGRLEAVTNEQAARTNA